MDIKKIFEKGLTIGTGWSFYSLWSWVYDNPIWLAVIANMGVVSGSLVLTAGALVNNLIFLVVYQRVGIDWLGVGVLEDLIQKLQQQVDKGRAFIKGCKSPALCMLVLLSVAVSELLLSAIQNKKILFIVLSIVEDSFVTTAVLRKKVGGELTRKDYGIFFASTVVGCAYWSVRNAILITILKGGWLIIKEILQTALS